MRLRYNGLEAALGAGITTTGQTSITFAAALTSLSGAVPTITGGDYIPLVIDDEIVYLTAYTTGTTSGTIVRNREGSTATTHSNSVPVIQPALAGDFYAVDAAIVTGSDMHDFNRADTTSLPSVFSWANQQSATYRERAGRGVITYPPSTSVQIIGLELPSVGSTWDYAAKLSGVAQGGINFYEINMFARDSSGARVLSLSLDARGMAWKRWTTLTSWQSESGFTTVPGWPHADWIWLRMKKTSGSNLEYYYSQDGLDWVKLITLDPSAWLTSGSDRIGWGASYSTGAHPTSLVRCGWFGPVV